MIYDISPAITPDIAVFPGDTPLRREVLCDMAKGAALTLSTIHATCHLGAHADGPNHYGVDARAIDQQPLDRYLGRCQVIETTVPRGKRVTPEHLTAAMSEERILFKTGTWPEPTEFNPDFAGLSVDLVEAMAAAGVRTVGIDTPSVDTADSKDLPAHRVILRHDIAILEYLDLSKVPAGFYELIALPLKLVGFDASPVRAVLRTLD